jgi:O-antigen/teichoic acid export membrane protein
VSPGSTPETEGGRRELTGLVVRGVGWVAASQGAVQLLAFVTSVVIARALLPREVGLAGEALVFASLALAMLEFGLAAVLVQRPQLSEEDKSTAFWTATLFGLGLTLVGVALSWPIADLYGEPRVQSLFAVLSLSFVFAAPGVVQGALLTRELKFRSLELRVIVATTISSVTGMSLAVAGAGPWAIVSQYLAITSASTIFLWRSSPWRPRAIISRASLGNMAGFTTHVFGTRVLTWGNQNVDNFLIGRFLGAASLAVYSIAFNVIVTPVNRIATPLMQVFFPAFSRMRDPARIAGAWLRAVRMIALVVVPAMLTLVVVAPDFVAVLFGPKWHRAGPVVQILAPVGLLQSLMTLNNGILQSLDRTRVLFRFSLVMSAVTVGAFAAGLPWGLHGVATAYLLVTLVLQPMFLRLTTRAVGISAAEWFRSIWGVIQAGAGMLAAELAVHEALVSAGVPAGARLAAALLVGALVFVPLIAWRAPEVTGEIRALIARRRGSVAAAAPEGAEAQV